MRLIIWLVDVECRWFVTDYYKVGRRKRLPHGGAAPLFVAEGDDRVHTQGATGWDVARQQRDQDQYQRDGGEGNGISSTHRKKKIRHQSRQSKGCEDADGDPSARDFGSLGENHPQYAAALG